MENDDPLRWFFKRAFQIFIAWLAGGVGLAGF